MNDQGRTLVLGDLHGAYRALEQVLDRAGWSDTDRMIFLGDVADGWPDVRECVEWMYDRWSEDRLIHLLGNHDEWMRDWFRHVTNRPYIWTSQGGMATILSYGGHDSIPSHHKQLMEEARLWYEEDGRLFVHADWVPGVPAENQDPHNLIWGRALARKLAKGYVGGSGEGLVPEYDEVYIGHTATRDPEPIIHDGVHLIDTGAGWHGRLTLMDVENKDYWQSDLVTELYPNARGR